jgi:hypothetical protein
VGSRASLWLWLASAGCSSILGINDLSGPGDGAITPPVGDGSAGGTGDARPELPACGAQRMIELVGGNGGLAWFSLVWPMPSVITNFSTNFAYDDPSLASLVSTDPSHPLYARTLAGKPLWVGGAGSSPQPTAFIAGMNETHTREPESMVTTSNGINIIAAAAAAQDPLGATVPVFVFGATGPYGPASNAPAATSVTTIQDAITALEDAGAPASVAEGLAPSDAQLARYNTSTDGTATAFGQQLAFTANAFAAGLVSTVVLPAYDDDPHGAFDTGDAGPRANDTTTTLAAFYADLAMATERTCGTGTGPLSVADNTVMLIDGDTPKTSFVKQGWGDGTPQNANYVYLRSNGFTKPGWFGQLTFQQSYQPFDVDTGGVGGDVQIDTQAAEASLLYAVTRGNLAAVAAVTSADFTALRAK